jgi:hypothetical protein
MQHDAPGRDLRREASLHPVEDLVHVYLDLRKASAVSRFVVLGTESPRIDEVESFQLQSVQHQRREITLPHSDLYSDPAMKQEIEKRIAVFFCPRPTANRASHLPSTLLHQGHEVIPVRGVRAEQSGHECHWWIR